MIAARNPEILNLRGGNAQTERRALPAAQSLCYRLS